LDHIQLAKAVHAAPAAIHPQAATVHAQASTAHVLTTTLPHPTAVPIGNLGGMVPGSKADNRTGSHSVSVTESGSGSTTHGSLPAKPAGAAQAGSHTRDETGIQQVAETTSTSLALFERQQQREASQAAAAAATKKRQEEQQADAAAAAKAAQERQLQERQQAAAAAAAKNQQQEEALEAAAAAKKQQQEEALEAAATAQAARDRQAFLDALAANAAKERAEQQQALEAAAAAQAARNRQAFLDALAANAARERAEQQQALEAAAAAQAARDRQAFLDALAANAAKERVQSAPAHPVSTSTGTIGLPLPSQFLHNGTVDQGVDYVAPVGTPLYAMGSGRIVSTGIFGFGNNTPVLQIESGPLAGESVFYGHAASTLVPVGASVSQGEEIGTVGALGITNGPRLTIGFYPPGPMASGERMLALINSLVGYNTSQPAQAPAASTPQAAPQAAPPPHVPTGTPVSSSSSGSQAASGSLGTRQGFAVALLNALGAPVTSQNLLAVESWEVAEGGGFGGLTAFNPINTTLPMPGSRTVTAAGVQAYTSATQGFQATVDTLREGRYSGIVGALRAGNNARAVEQAVAASPWGTGPFLLLA
jgi:murein DD-endopeptidase MepM/ murein hydrolase activator NlpD